MRDGLRRGLVVVSVLAAAAAAILLAGYVIWGPGDPGQRAGIVAALLGVVGAVSPVIVWAWRHRRPVLEASTPAQVDAAADLLAIRTAAVWSRELVRRGIQAPAPVRVRWGWAPDDVALPKQELVSSPALSTDPDSLPPSAGNDPTSKAVLSSGVVTRLHDEVYARLRHGRLVLIGGPGAGKTGAMLLLLLKALQHRDKVPDPDRPAVPVPVWLTLGSWDPAAQGLREWVVTTMARDHPYLRAEEFGPDAIGALFDTGRIALFLDGLDEMPDNHRDRAVELLAAETAGLRVTLSSRPDQYRATLGAGQQLPYIAVVQLHPVGPQAAARYLLDGQIGPARDAWRRVTDQLLADQDSVLARTLSTPLTLSLARSAYAAGDPTELLAADLNSEAVLRGHLLDQIVIAAYPHPRERARAGNWLGWLAHQMNTQPAGPTRDLSWWDIPTWAERRSSRLVGALVGGLVLALTWWLILLPIDFGSELVVLASILVGGLVVGPLIGLVVAVAVGHLGGISQSAPTRHGSQTAGSGDTTILGALLFCLPLGLSILGLLVYALGRDIDDLMSITIWLGQWIVPGAGLLFAFAIGRLSRSAPRSMILRRPTGHDARRGRRIILAGGLPIGVMVCVALSLTVGSVLLLLYEAYHPETYDLEPAEEVLPAEPNWVALGIGLTITILVIGYIAALLAGLLFWLVGDVWNLPLAAADDVTPRSVYRKDAQARLISAFLYALVAGLVGGLVAGFTMGLLSIGASPVMDDMVLGETVLYSGFLAAVLIGPLFGLVGAFRDSSAPILLCTELACLLRGRPVRFLHLLEDARERQILRQAGAVYQFRHADLQDRLANQHRQQARTGPALTSTT